MSERPTWDEYFKEIVTITAKRSSCDRLNVGCLLVKNNRIISQGYNGHLPGLAHESIMENGHEIAIEHLLKSYGYVSFNDIKLKKTDKQNLNY